MRKVRKDRFGDLAQKLTLDALTDGSVRLTLT